MTLQKQYCSKSYTCQYWEVTLQHVSLTCKIENPRSSQTYGYYFTHTSYNCILSFSCSKVKTHPQNSQPLTAYSKWLLKSQIISAEESNSTSTFSDISDTTCSSRLQLCKQEINFNLTTAHNVPDRKYQNLSSHSVLKITTVDTGH